MLLEVRSKRTESSTGAPLHLNVSLERRNGDVVHAIIHQGDWKSARIQGEFTSGSDINQARGNLQLAMSQLGDLNRLLGSTLQGSVSGNAALTPGCQVTRT